LLLRAVPEINASVLTGPTRTPSYPHWTLHGPSVFSRTERDAVRLARP